MRGRAYVGTVMGLVLGALGGQAVSGERTLPLAADADGVCLQRASNPSAEASWSSS